MIRARLDRLGTVERRVIAAGAVLGDGFSFEALREVANLEEDEVVGALEDLLARRLVLATNGRYQFSYDYVRQVAFDETSELRRRWSFPASSGRSTSSPPRRSARREMRPARGATSKAPGRSCMASG